MSATPERKSSKRALKAVGAGALGVALLAGGTTFAKWYEEQQIGDSNLQAGHLNMEVTEAQWVDVNNGNTVIDEANFRMVPGDVLRYTATVTPDLVGDNLEATLQVNTTGTVTGDLADIVNVTTTVGGAGTTEQTLTPENSGDPIEVSVELEFPLTTDGAAPADDKSNWWGAQGEDATVNLESTNIELNQVDNP